VDLPGQYWSAEGTMSLALAASRTRYAIATDLAQSIDGRHSVQIVELDAETGEALLPPWAAEDDRNDATVHPSLAYLPDDSLLVAWESDAHNGTVARLFDASTSKPRFSSVACNEESFPVGARRMDAAPGMVSSLLASERVLVVHSGKPSYDANGVGVVAWGLPFSKLWPAASN